MSVIAVVAVVVLVAIANFASAFLDIDGLQFSELSNVVVVSSSGGGGLMFWPMLALSIIVVGGVVGGVSFWNVRRNKKRDERIISRLKAGQRHDATITSATKSETYQRGQMSYTRLDVRATISDGESFAGEIEEPVGTELPAVAINESAGVWVHGGGSIIVTQNGVFESK